MKLTSEHAARFERDGFLAFPGIKHCVGFAIDTSTHAMRIRSAMEEQFAPSR